MDFRSKIFIAPPFGNWITRRDCISVRGTYTLEPRPGLLRHALATVRPVPGGWVNKVGLRNKGVRRAKVQPPHAVSIVALNGDGEWLALSEALPPLTTVEVNLGCPNEDFCPIVPRVLARICQRHRVIVKLPSTGPWLHLLAMAEQAGAGALHLSNTLPSPRGGVSGAQLREINLPRVQTAAERSRLPVIAGGGIYSIEDAVSYWTAGAASFSLGTVWFNPVRARLLTRDITRCILSKIS